MKSALPKVLHNIAGQPMVRHVLDAVEPLVPAETLVVVGPDMDNVAAAVRPAKNVIQKDQAGTGDAVRVAVESMSTRTGTVLAVWRRPVDPHRNRQPVAAARQAGASVVVLGSAGDPTDTVVSSTKKARWKPLSKTRTREKGDRSLQCRCHGNDASYRDLWHVSETTMPRSTRRISSAWRELMGGIACRNSR